jgi:hypothetical protein
MQRRKAFPDFHGATTSPDSVGHLNVEAHNQHDWTRPEMESWTDFSAVEQAAC